MTDDEWFKIRAEMEQVFKSGKIAESSPQDLQRFLSVACSGHIDNKTIHPREIVRGLTINHVQMSRVIDKLESTIERLNKENSKKDILIIILAILSMLATTAGIFT